MTVPIELLEAADRTPARAAPNPEGLLPGRSSFARLAAQSLDTESQGRRRHAGRNDRRVFPRLPSIGGAYIVYVEGSGAISDISQTGVFISDERPLPVGTQLSFELCLGKHTIPVRGVVRRSIPKIGMGIEFLLIPPASRKLIRQYLQDLASSPES